MLELRGVTARYGEVVAVRDLDLTITEGETVALIGRNGAGKTTTLALAAGSIDPVAGDILWDGASILGQGPEERVRSGVVLVPEGRGIFPALSVEENLKMGGFWRRPGRRETARALAEVYDLLPRLAARRRVSGGSLSGGEQQMLAIGRALMSSPRLLLLDEPSLGLSPVMVDALYELLGELIDKGIALLLVEQYVPLALKLCRRAVGLNKGNVVLASSAGDVAASDIADVYMAPSVGDALPASAPGQA